MDSPQQMTAQPATARKRRPIFPLLFVAAGILALTLIVILTINGPPDEKLTWLTPEQLARAYHPGRYEKIKEKVGGWIDALFHRNHGTPPNVLIDAKVLELTASEADLLKLGEPMTTNASGMRAWILPPLESAALRSRLATVAKNSAISSPRIQTEAGRQAKLFIGQQVPAGPAGSNTGVGLTVDLFPQYASNSVRLLAGVSSTEVAGATATNVLIVTNFAFACRALVPDGGGLVVDCANATNGKGNWFYLVPVLIDNTGKRLKR